MFSMGLRSNNLVEIFKASAPTLLQLLNNADHFVWHYALCVVMAKYNSLMLAFIETFLLPLNVQPNLSPLFCSPSKLESDLTAWFWTGNPLYPDTWQHVCSKMFGSSFFFKYGNKTLTLHANLVIWKVAFFLAGCSGSQNCLTLSLLIYCGLFLLPQPLLVYVEQSTNHTAHDCT